MCLAFPPCPPSQEWFNVYEHSRHTSCTVSDLIVGNEYYFRVFSENICGLSDSPGVSKNTARILKTGAGRSALALSWDSWLLAPVQRCGGSYLMVVFHSPGITLKPLEYKEHDFRTAPKFLTPLMDRVVVAGYTAALNCAVRGHPKVPGLGPGKPLAVYDPRTHTPAAPPCGLLRQRPSLRQF